MELLALPIRRYWDVEDFPRDAWVEPLTRPLADLRVDPRTDLWVDRLGREEGGQGLLADLLMGQALQLCGVETLADAWSSSRFDGELARLLLLCMKPALCARMGSRMGPNVDPPTPSRMSRRDLKRVWCAIYRARGTDNPTD